MRVMGIETSCDETAVAIVEAPDAGHRPVGRILANVIYSQMTEHRRFGGVVPEIAARAHLERIDGLVEEALVARQPCDDDGRGAMAVLTPAGLSVLEQAAPLHVEGIRRYLIDPISGSAGDEGLAGLARGLDRIDRVLQEG